MVKVDVTNIQFEDQSFDVILCSHVLEHVEDDRKALGELFRVLKAGGWAVLQVPIDETREVTYEDPSIVSPEERERAFGQYDHVRIYGTDYSERLEGAGFRATADHYVEELGRDLVTHCALPKEIVYFCEKPNVSRVSTAIFAED